jgi:hypothetical protein
LRTRQTRPKEKGTVTSVWTFGSSTEHINTVFARNNIDRELLEYRAESFDVCQVQLFQSIFEGDYTIGSNWTGILYLALGAPSYLSQVCIS